MKALPALVSAFQRSRSSRINLRLLVKTGIVLITLVIVFSVIFQVLMVAEGQQHSWVTAFYWTVVTMSTLGVGDILFVDDPGRAFTALVLATGVVMVFVVFPFTFIEAFYLPWIEVRKQSRAPRRLSRFLRGHVILTSSDPITLALIRKLSHFHYSYALLIPDFNDALRLADQGLNVMVGDLDNPKTYRDAQIQIASLVATLCSKDTVNANVVATVRQLSDSIPIVATAQQPTSADVLRRAGATHVFQPAEMLGKSLARRSYGGAQRAQVVAQFDGLLVAEATVRGTPLIGQRLVETELRGATGLNVLGVWTRGLFESTEPDLAITDNTVLVLAGSQEQLNRFNEHYPQPQVSDKPVVIIGGGRVGQATGRALTEIGIDYRIVELAPDETLDPARTVAGDAAKLSVLQRAGIEEAPTVIVTTHDDDINIYLTIWLRSLRPDIVLISRSMRERNLATLHRAGADFVMSHASMGATTVFNLLKRSDIEMLAEGLDIFRLPVPPGLVGKTISGADIRRRTGCTVVALYTPDGLQVNPDPEQPLPAEAELLMIGTVEKEALFLEKYPIRVTNWFRR